jgi:hypothetical protein
MIASCKAGKGNSVYFWSDTWDLGVPKWKYPQLFSFAKNQNISLQKFLSQDAYANFFTPLSEEAVEQWSELDNLIQRLELVSSKDDRWSYIWGSSVFTPKLAYKQLQGSFIAHPLFSWLWKSCCRGKHKFFDWLLFCDRLNTRAILGRKNRPLDNFNCVLCLHGYEETLEHLLFQCSYSQWCWCLLHISWSALDCCLDRIVDGRQRFGQRIYREILL